MNPSSTSPTMDAAAGVAGVDIDALDVSERWKKYFKGLQGVGGLSMPLLKALPKEERKQRWKEVQPPLASFALAFVFGLFYYIAKGMWKKGLVLLAIVLPIVFVVGTIFYMVGGETLANATRFWGAVIFGIMAPRDFYAKKVLGDEGWLPVRPW